MLYIALLPLQLEVWSSNKNCPIVATHAGQPACQDPHKEWQWPRNRDVAISLAICFPSPDKELQQWLAYFERNAIDWTVMAGLYEGVLRIRRIITALENKRIILARESALIQRVPLQDLTCSELLWSTRKSWLCINIDICFRLAFVQ